MGLSVPAEAPAGSMACERGEGAFAPGGGCGEGPETARRCCLFAPEPEGACDGAHPAPPAFRRCQRASHAAVRYGAAEQLDCGPLGVWQRWGLAGAFLEKLIGQQTLPGWIAFEHWVLCLIFDVVAAIWSLVFGAGAAGAGRIPHGGGPSPAVAWHPHRDVFATLSPRGTLAVHSMGDAFSASSTQYLHADGSHGFPLRMAWQPNSIRGSLAVGMSAGLAVWRHAEPEGWRCAWSLRGDAFACPAVTWSPDGRCLAAAAAHGIVRVWPHSGLSSEQPMPWCVTLRRWSSGPVTDLQWGPDGSTLAVAHAGRAHFVRLWNTQTWEVSRDIGLGRPAPSAGPSVAWCSNETLIGAAGGQLFEVSGVGGGNGSGLAFGFEPMSRVLPVPQLRTPGGHAAEEGGRQAVVEVAVCPRTHQRIAALVDGAPHVLVFERLGAEGWARAELALLGAVGVDTEVHADLFREDSPSMGGDGCGMANPRAIAFAGNVVRRQRGDAPFEGSLLAVYWEFRHGAAEVRTYPMHYLPYKLMHSDLSVLFD